MVKEIYVNLPVKDLQKSIAFFTKLGFTFNAQFTDDNATCMVLSNTIYVMLLVESYFKTFTDKPVSDATKSTEVITAISVSSRNEVDELVDKALAAGATSHKPTDDHGWMYIRRFTDLDGHLWEVLYIDASKVPSA